MSSTSEVNIFRSVCLIFRKISEHSRLVIIKVHHAPYIWLFLPLLLTNQQTLLVTSEVQKEHCLRKKKCSTSGVFLLLDWFPHPVPQALEPNALSDPTLTSLFPRILFYCPLANITLLIFHVLAKTLTSIISTLLQPKIIEMATKLDQSDISASITWCSCLGTACHFLQSFLTEHKNLVDPLTDVLGKQQ